MEKIKSNKNNFYNIFKASDPNAFSLIFIFFIDKSKLSEYTYFYKRNGFVN